MEKTEFTTLKESSQPFNILQERKTDNKVQVEEFKTELDKVIFSLNKMLNIWMDLTNEPEDELLEKKYPFPYSLDEQICEINEWRDSIEEITNQQGGRRNYES